MISHDPLLAGKPDITYSSNRVHKFIELSRYDVDFRKILFDRLERLSLLRNGMTVLCLAARIGTEVKAFFDIGCFAVGIDLNPGENNRYVVYGDFHDIQFPSN